MSAGGRTTWSARDAVHHDRELVVELLEEFGPAGPYVDVVLRDLAQQQRPRRNRDSDEDEGAGWVKTGWRSLGRKTGVSADEVRRIVEHGAEIGLFDDLTIDPDGRRFTLRCSGWVADQDRGQAAFKKADQRARAAEDTSPPEGDESTPSGDMSPSPEDMSPSDSPTRPDQTKEQNSPSARVGDIADLQRKVQLVFDTWIDSTGRDANRTQLSQKRRRLIIAAIRSHGLDDCLKAVAHIGQDPWAMGANDRGRPFNDIEHALGNAERIERWRDWTPGGARRPAADGHREEVNACPPNVYLEARQAFASMVTAARAAVGADTFDLWLAQLHPHRLIASGDGFYVLELGGPPETLAWIQERFGRTLTRAAGMEVRIVSCTNDATAAAA